MIDVNELQSHIWMLIKEVVPAKAGIQSPIPKNDVLNLSSNKNFLEKKLDPRLRGDDAVEKPIHPRIASPAHPEEAFKAVSKDIIVGLSGGADSVFLLHQLVQLSKTIPLNIIAAHLQHDWRGQADADDAAFCKELSTSLGIDFVSKKACNIVIDKKWNGSQEEIGRHQRRAFLHQLLHEHQAGAIALGHQTQDQEETFFIRLLRGASLEGLCGMQARDGFIIRPLLEIQRTDIEHWLTQNGHSWCQDSDNTNPRFLRNRIRHEFLPVLRSIDQRFTSNFARTLQQLQQEQSLIDELVETTYKQIFDPVKTARPEPVEGSQSGNLPLFKVLNPMLQGHILKKLFITNNVQFALSEGFIDEALRFLNSPRGGTHQLNQAWCIEKKGSCFWISKK